MQRARPQGSTGFRKGQGATHITCSTSQAKRQAMMHDACQQPLHIYKRNHFHAGQQARCLANQQNKPAKAPARF